MNNRFTEFSQSPLGRKIVSIIDTQDRHIEFAAFSREGFPAVTALVSELTPVLETARQSDPKVFNFAKQFIGDYVGGMMRAQDFEIAHKAKSVPGKLFTVGAVWAKKTV